MCETIAAIIVTFNRKHLLTQCLNALLSQTRVPDKIVVVDNASSDGTPELLQEKGYLDNSVIDYVRLPENTGGAGGFHEGMKRAYEGNYDWLWLMDDDGYPAPDCLEKLLEARESLEIIGSVVVLPEDSSKLTWSLIVFEKDSYFSLRKRIRDRNELLNVSNQNIYPSYAAFFNAVLIHWKVIDKIGFVLKDLFIRGDEFEYFLRSRKYKINMGTKIDALYHHPHQLFHINKLKYFYAFRNLFYNYTQYKNVTYHPFARILFLSYRFIQYIKMSPSLSPNYMFKVLRAVYWATKGKLIAYEPCE
jgi:rhamnopyranosyl-N-acetylglucosaminyl-diphospho-decaprenol beta-1,3/1,4-galactofuranosyltransferase